jgi:hypothetical protein
MITISDIPEEVKSLLSKVQEFSRDEAILAGGYLRDLDHGVEPKDIDIFVPADWDRREFFDFLQAYLITPTNFGFKESAENDDTILEQIIFEDSDVFPGLPINILVCKSAIKPADRFERFDYGLCQIMYDGEDLLRSAAYMKDKANGTFTLMRYTGPEAHENSLQRFKRFKARYPNHRLVIPDWIVPRVTAYKA